MRSSLLTTDDTKETQSKLDYYPAVLAGVFSALTLLCWSYLPAVITALTFGGAVTSVMVGIMSAIEHVGGKTK